MIRACILAIAMGLAADTPTTGGKPETVTRSGKVVLLTAALKARGIPADPDPIAKEVVLVESGGAISPILPDEASRALFTDARLRDRKAEITARKFPGLPHLQLVSLKVEDDGVLRTPEYYCDICTIS